MDHRYFRAGVGTIIYNDAGDILVWQRVAYPSGIWQLQQGGIDKGETPETAVWRELQEETGFTKDDLTDLHQYPYWTVYADVEAVENTDKDRLGQAHTWYFAKLAPGVTPDLSKAHDQEFGDYKWTTFAELIADTNPLKKHVYEILGAYFAEVLQ